MKAAKPLSTIEYLELMKDKLIKEGGTGSDYSISKTLNISYPAISRYRNKGGTMDVKTCIKVADYLGIDRLTVIAAAHMERAPSAEDKKFWKEVISTAAALLLVFSGFFVTDNAKADTPALSSVPMIYIMLNRIWAIIGLYLKPLTRPADLVYTL